VARKVIDMPRMARNSIIRSGMALAWPFTSYTIGPDQDGGWRGNGRYGGARHLPAWLGGVRIEDDVLVTPDGCEVLTGVTNDLEECVVQ